MTIDEALKQVSKGVKLEFISKLNSGKYILSEIKEKAPSRDFFSLDVGYYEAPPGHWNQIDKEEKTGLYQDEETGEKLTFEQVEALKPQYLLFLYEYGRQWSNVPLDNVLVTGFKCINIGYPPEMYLNSLLIKKI